MKFIDFMDDKFIRFRSPFIERMDKTPIKNLMENSETYNELEQEKNEILEKYTFINDLIDGNEPIKESYSNEDIQALKDFFDCARKMDNYERLEIYKLGHHDCILWMKMTGIL